MLCSFKYRNEIYIYIKFTNYAFKFAVLAMRSLCSKTGLFAFKVMIDLCRKRKITVQTYFCK